MQQTESAKGQLAARDLVSDTTGLTALRVAFDLPVSSRTITHGTYFSVNEEIEIVAGMPIMPRTSVSVTLGSEYARGAFFEGGHYQTYTSFDPIIARLVTDTAAHLGEPLYDFEEWVPSAWDVVNSIETPEGSQQRLVILPAQYSAASPFTGTMRVFDAMTYTVYYSDTEDIWPPSFWLVEDGIAGSSQIITAEVTDRSGVSRVAVGYTWGDGWWHVVEMTGTADNPNLWVGAVPYADTLSYFVQAADTAGNVGVNTNKALYFFTLSAPGPPSDVRISGQTAGIVQTSYTFTATVVPITTTQPITYVWQASGHPPVTHTSRWEASDVLSITWNVTGTQVLTVTAANSVGSATGTHTIIIGAEGPVCPRPLTGVHIVGPAGVFTGTLYVGAIYSFTAVITPSDATRPITYTWLPAPESGGYTDTALYQWATPDTYTITVTAENCGGPVNAQRVITVHTQQHYIYLPSVIRSYAAPRGLSRATGPPPTLDGRQRL